MNDKISFITDLLNSKKIESSQKEKIFSLTADEFKKSKNVDERILEGIEEIKIELKNILKINGNNSSPSDDKLKEAYSNNILPVEESNLAKSELNGSFIKQLSTYIDPFEEYGLSKFLQAYNENLILNSTCHEIDDEGSLKMLLNHCEINEYDFSKHLEAIKLEFEILTGLYTINVKIYSLIKAYIHGGVKWSSDKIEMSWSDPALLKWSLLNKSNIPNPGVNLMEKYEKEGFQLSRPFVSTLTGQNIVSFSNFVLLFKSMFHINSNNSLKRNIIRFNENKRSNTWADIELSENNFSENIHLYTDVDKLIQTYGKLMDLIKSVNTEYSVTTRPKILLSFFEEQNSIIFSIHHINSTFKKSLMSTVNHPFGLSMWPIIEKQINGLCNLELRADFGSSDFARINLWDGNGISIKEKLKKFEGVEYILKFNR